MTVLRPGDPPPPIKQYPVYARSGWEIPQPNHERPILTIEEMAGWANFFGSRYRATPRSLSRHPYNCVGMIFASRCAYIEIDRIYEILREIEHFMENVLPTLGKPVEFYTERQL